MGRAKEGEVFEAPILELKSEHCDWQIFQFKNGGPNSRSRQLPVFNMAYTYVGDDSSKCPLPIRLSNTISYECKMCCRLLVFKNRGSAVCHRSCVGRLSKEQISVQHHWTSVDHHGEPITRVTNSICYYMIAIVDPNLKWLEKELIRGQKRRDAVCDFSWWALQCRKIFTYHQKMS